jgi:TldD protein
MTDAFAIARQRLLEPAALAAGDLERLFAEVMGPGVDRADVYFQHSRHESWVLEDGIVREGSHAIEQGAGVRAISGEKTGFAYTDEIALPALLEASASARARHGGT